MKVAVLLIALPVVLGAQQTDPGTGARIISQKEAVELAEKNAPTAIQSKGTIRTAEGAVKTAAAQFLPTLSLGLGQTKGGGENRNPVTGQIESYAQRPWAYSNSLGIGLPIVFDGGQRMSNIRAAKANVDVAEANDVNTKFGLALQVKQQYASILAAREQESAARTQLEEANQQLAVSSAKVRAGASILSDSLRSYIAVENAKLAILTAQDALRNANAQLTRLVGSDVTVTASPADTADATLAPLDSALMMKMALEGPTIEAQNATLQAAQASYVTTTRAYYPSISASVSYGGSGNDEFYGLHTPFAYGYSYGLSLNFPIFDRFGRDEAKVRAQIGVTNQEATLRETRLSAQANMIQELGAINISSEQIRINQLTLAASEEDLRVQQTRYQLGASTLVDVLTSQTAVNDARLALIQARLNYRTARAQIEAIIGRDLE